MNNLTSDELWPITLYLDQYVPDTARSVVDGLKGVDDETFAVGMKVFAMEAEKTK